MGHVHVMHLRDSRGIFGAERVILGILRNYDREIFDISLLCLKRGDGASDALIAEARKYGIRVYTVDVNGKLDFSALREIRRLFREAKIDIFHSHDFKSDFYGWFASRGVGVRRITTAHGSTRDSLKKRLYLLLNEKLVWRQFDRIIAVSNQLKSDLLSSGLGVKRVCLVKNGLDLESLNSGSGSGAEVSLPKSCLDGTVFAVIGRLFPDKGHLLFLDAFAEVYRTNKDVCALIIGDGPFRGAIDEHIKNLDIEKAVHMLGVRSDMGELYKNIDCLVIASLREGLPYVLLEAMAMDVNVISTRVGEIPQLIDDGVNGRLVPPGDTVKLAEAMVAYLNMPDNVCSQWRLNAREKVEKEYTVEVMTRATEKLYQESL